MNCRICGLILPVEWGWSSGQTYLNWDARIADEGHPQGGEGGGEHLNTFLSTEGRGGARRTATATPFVHGEPRRGTEYGNGNTFCPRRAAEGRGEHLNTILSTKGHEGAGRTPFLSAKGREGARRKPFFVHEGPRRGRENRAIASKFGRHNSPRRAPTRGAPTDSGSLTWVCLNLMPLPWGGGSPAHGGMDLCGVPVACLD